jgi:undecaprenyl-diphosphatase
LLIPFRERPFHEGLDLRIPVSIDKHDFESWSAFPSDHVTLFFALGTGLWLVSRTLGFLVLLHAVLVIGLPRIYLLIHHPSDAVAGALLGSGCALIANLPSIRDRLTESFLGLAKKQPAWFYALAFFTTYQMATLFDGVRYLGKFLVAVGEAVVSRLG